MQEIPLFSTAGSKQSSWFLPAATRTVAKAGPLDISFKIEPSGWYPWNELGVLKVADLRMQDREAWPTHISGMLTWWWHQVEWNVTSAWPRSSDWVQKLEETGIMISCARKFYIRILLDRLTMSSWTMGLLEQIYGMPLFCFTLLDSNQELFAYILILIRFLKQLKHKNPAFVC